MFLHFVVALLLRGCYILPPAMVGFCHKDELDAILQALSSFPARHCGICCFFVMCFDGFGGLRLMLELVGETNQVQA